MKTENGKETRGGGSHCPMCGGGPAIPGVACPNCGFVPPARRTAGPQRDSGKRLWIALAVALLSLLLSFCLLYALVRTVRLG